MKVSIIVPIYNVEQYIRPCIQTIIKQTHKDIEIILVDDGSTDNSSVICDDLAKEDPRIVVIHKQNGGLSDARNAGLKKATGSYIMFVDGDDLIDQDMVKSLLLLAEENKAQIAICNRKKYYDTEKGQRYIDAHPNPHTYLLMNKEDALIELCSFRFFDMSACDKIYRKELFSNIQFPINKLSEDYYIMYLLFDKCNKIAYTNQPLYIYRQRQGSITKNAKINEDYAKAAKEQMIYLDKKYPELKKYSHSAYALSVINICNQYLENRHTLPALDQYEKLRALVVPEYQYVQKNEKISRSRKAQVRIFLMNRKMYGIMYILYKKLGK